MSELSKHRSKLKTVVAGSLQVGLVDFAGVLCCLQSAGGAMPEIAGWLEGFGGYVAKYWVDGVLVYLGYPRTHEDDAERVVQAGLEYRRQRRHSRGLGWRAGVSGRHILEFEVRNGGFVEPVSARHFPISVSACLRPVRYVMETGLRSRFRACTAAQVERSIDCPVRGKARGSVSHGP
jgi:hypothetical protein